MSKLIKKIFNIFLRVFWIFRIREKTIVISFFNGSAVGGDGKALLDYSNEKNLGYKFYWIVNKNFNKKEHKFNDVKYIRKWSIPFFFRSLTSKIIFTNINHVSFLPYRKHQCLVNGWHGYGYKVVHQGNNISNEELIKIFNLNNLFLSPNKLATDKKIREAFKYEGKVLEIGTPCCDIFFKKEKVESLTAKFKKDYGVEKDEKLLLYAPTFRQDFSFEEGGLDFSNLIKELNKKFSSKWKILYRVHPMIAGTTKVDNPNVIDVTKYDDMNELLAISDILITDYSSTFWELAIQRKPVFIYAYDLEKYEKNDRGFILPTSEWPFPIATSNEELAKAIKEFDDSAYNKTLDAYFKKYGNYEKGTACAQFFSEIEKL